MNLKKFFKKIQSNQKNVKFNDIITFLKGLGFVSRIPGRGGSHLVFFQKGINERINIQEKKGEAKAYQIKQIIKVVESYNLLPGDEE